MSKVTPMGIDELISRIKNRTVNLPDSSVTLQSLNDWITGYTAANDDILSIVYEFREELNDGR